MPSPTLCHPAQLLHRVWSEFVHTFFNNSGLQKRFLKKPNPVGFIGFIWFWGLNPGFVKRPNLTGSGISMAFQLSERWLLDRYSPQINKRYWRFFVSFYAPQLYRQVLAMGILSVSPSVTTRWYTKPRWDRDSGSSPYGSLEYLVSYEVIWWKWVKRLPSNEGIKEGYPPLEITILPLLAHLVWKRLQIDTDLLRIITSTADEFSSGTNIDDLERPW